MKANPFAARSGIQEKGLYVTFWIGESRLDSLASQPLPLRPGEALEAGKQAVYLYCPLGYGDTKINNSFVERRLGCPCTTRNWRTLQALLSMSLQ